MGLGGYLAAKSDAEHYASELRREQREIVERPDDEVAEVKEVFLAYGLNDEQIQPIIEAMQAQPRHWVDFMMRFELGLEKPEPKRALTSALTIAGAYIAGGLIPLMPYMVLATVRSSLLFSVFVTLIALLIFGFVKGHFTGAKPARSAFQTTMIGGLAAAAAFAIARFIGS
jgi:VIT1/CCC1 family predicted Fe2+/Mn2+ transporter